jgi:outer membrane protein TolC
MKPIIAGLAIAFAVFLGIPPAANAESMTIDQCVAIALEQNLGIKQADENVAIAKARIGVSRAAFLPMLSMSYGYTRLDDEPTMLMPDMGPMFPASIIVGTTDNYALAFDARQPIFAGGSIYYTYKASKTGQDVASYDKAAQMNDVVEQAKAAYYNVLKARRIRDASKSYVDMLEAHMKTAQAFYDVKMAPLNDLLRAEVELASGQRALLTAENSLKMAESQFNIVLRRAINEKVDLKDDMLAMRYSESLDSSIAIAIKERPEVRSARSRKMQSESLLKAAKGDYLPSINAAGHLERDGNAWDVNGSKYKDASSWYLTAAASWNFWEWGRTKSRVDESKARLSQSDMAVSQIEDRVSLEAKKAWLDLEDSSKQVEVAFSAIRRAEENYRVSAERYRERLGTGTEVLDAEALLTRARSDYASALGDNAIALARLERAMGIKIETASLIPGGAR